MITKIAAITDKLRIEIMQILTDNGKACVQDITEMLHDKKIFATQPNVSQALRILRDSNVVDYNRHGTYKIYYVKRKDLFIELKNIIIKYENA